ncbi:hypothetical protein GY45DRAFT_1092305 [Cubamyces sp. BRFM 1775]|nr:hypothetical protein GY45DRAFT_1092305 [Cubamyces sp. BRFM 1775]
MRSHPASASQPTTRPFSPSQSVHIPFCHASSLPAIFPVTEDTYDGTSAESSPTAVRSGGIGPFHLNTVVAISAEQELGGAVLYCGVYERGRYGDEENEFVQGSSTCPAPAYIQRFLSSPSPTDILRNYQEQEQRHLSIVTNETLTIDPRLLALGPSTTSASPSLPSMPFTFDDHQSPYYPDSLPSPTTPALSASDEDGPETTPLAGVTESDTLACAIGVEQALLAKASEPEVTYIPSSAAPSPLPSGSSKRKRADSEASDEEPINTIRPVKKARTDPQSPTTDETPTNVEEEVSANGPESTTTEAPNPAHSRRARRTKDTIDRYLNAVPKSDCPVAGCMEQFGGDRVTNFKHLQRHYKSLGSLRGSSEVGCLWGCDGLVASNQMHAHVAQKHLGFTYHCPLKDAKQCPWTGKRAKDTRQHLQKKHNNIKNMWPEEFR